MSIHKSLQTKGKLTVHRNVLKRHERVTILEKEGKLASAASIFGLPKVKHLKMKARKKVKKVEAATVEGVGAVPGAAPAAPGATPAAPAAGAKAGAPAAKAPAAAPAKGADKKPAK